MPGLYGLSSNANVTVFNTTGLYNVGNGNVIVGNVSVNNTTGLYGGLGNPNVLTNAEVLFSLLSESGNVQFQLTNGNTQVLAYTTISQYGNSNVAAYLPVYGGTINATDVFNPGQVNLSSNGFTQLQYTPDGLPANAYDLGTGSWLYLDNSGVVFQSNVNGISKSVYIDNNANITIDGRLTTTGGIFWANGDPYSSGGGGGSGSYGNANVAAYLPTYTGSLENSSSIINLWANAATQSIAISTLNANLGAFETYANAHFGTSSYGNANVAAYLPTDPTFTGYLTFANANAATQATAINTINANLGAFQTYANIHFGDSNYGNANVAAYLPTYSGSLENSSSIINLWSNAASQATDINTLFANAASQATSINTLFANAATQATQIATLDANLGTATTNITTLFANAATQATQIASTNANVTAANAAIVTVQNNLNDFETYANIHFGDTTYGNANVIALMANFDGYPIVTTGNITTGNLTVNSQEVTGNIRSAGGYFWSNGSVYGVTRIVSGSNIIVSPASGVGEVTISSTAGGGAGGTSTGYYGSFYDSTNQYANVATQAYTWNIGTTVGTNGVTITGGNAITFSYAGVYNIQFSTQLVNTDNTTHEANIWIRQNGTDVPASGGQVTVPARKSASVPGALIATWNYVLPVGAADKITFVWQQDSNDSSVYIQNQTVGSNPTRPSDPGIILTATQVTSVTGDPFGNSNVATFLSSGFGSNTITTTGNITAGYFLGDGSKLTNMYGNTQVAAYFPTDPTFTGYTAFANANAATQATSINTINANLGAYQTYANTQISTINANLGAYQTYANTRIQTIDANLGAFETYANIQFASAIYSNTNVQAFLNNTVTTVSGLGSLTTTNTVTAGTNLQALASTQATQAFQSGSMWTVGGASVYRDLWVGGNIFTANTDGKANITVAANSYFLGDGSKLSNMYGNTQVAAYLLTNTGNIQAGYFIGDGSKLTNITSSYGNANVAAYLGTNPGIPTLVANTVQSATGANLVLSGTNINLSAPSYIVNNKFTVQGGNIYTTYSTGLNAGGNVFADNYNFANGVNILSTVSGGTYGNTQVAAYLPTYSGNIGGQLTNGTQPYINLIGTGSGGGYLSLGSFGATIASTTTNGNINLGNNTTQFANIFLNSNTIGARGSFITNGGMAAAGAYTGNYFDGTVVDYVSGNGRISVGPSDNLTFYTGGIGVTPMVVFGQTGTINAAGAATLGNVITTGGVFWANGVAYSSGSGSSFTGNLLGSTLLDSTNQRIFANASPLSTPASWAGSNFDNLVKQSPVYTSGVLQAPPTSSGNVNNSTYTIGQVTSGNIGYQSSYQTTNNRTVTTATNLLQVWPTTANTMTNNDRVRGSVNAVDVMLSGKTWGTVANTATTVAGSFNQVGITQGGNLNAAIGVGGFITVTPTTAGTSANLTYGTALFGAVSLSATGGSANQGNIQYARLVSGVLSGFSSNLTVTNAIGLHTPAAWAGGITPATGALNKYAVLNEDPNTVIQTNGNLLVANIIASSTGVFTMPVGGNSTRPAFAANGSIRFNSDYQNPEWYNGANSTWYKFSTGYTAGGGSYSASYLVVAGGASGGDRIGAGGGAGGLLSGTATLNSGTTYTIVVGAGGTATFSSPGHVGNNGSDSTIAALSLTAVGGGGGGSYIGSSATAGSSGGSGGGGSFSGNGGSNAAGSGTSGQGSAGGNGTATDTSGGGGGGAGGVGQAAQSGSNGGNGGTGVSNSITGSAVNYAGGGGGCGERGSTAGSGGTGGGGAGAVANNNATAGTANTGGGGGGARNSDDTSNVYAGAGGSGVVIISVPTANYTGTTTGSPTVTTDGSNTVMKFTASGSYTA